jgi:hypothetical protein
VKQVLALTIGAALAFSLGAHAQEAIPTATNSPGGGAPPAASGGPISLADKSSHYDDRGPVPIGPCGAPYKQTDDGQLKQDKNPHGAVWGGVGTHGYREAGGAVCIPLGDNSQVTVAVDTTHWGGRH